MFDSYQKIRLRYLAFCCNEKRPGYAEANVRLDAYIAELQETHPKLFHNRDTLHRRVFMDRPVLTIPYSHSIRDYDNSTLKMIESTQ